MDWLEIGLWVTLFSRAGWPSEFPVVESDISGSKLVIARVFQIHCRDGLTRYVTFFVLVSSFIKVRAPCSSQRQWTLFEQPYFLNFLVKWFRKLMFLTKDVLTRSSDMITKTSSRCFFWRPLVMKLRRRGLIFYDSLTNIFFDFILWTFFSKKKRFLYQIYFFLFGLNVIVTTEQIILIIIFRCQICLYTFFFGVNSLKSNLFRYSLTKGE